MNWFDKILIKGASFRNKMFNVIASHGFDGWFYIFFTCLLTQLLSTIIPLITAVVFSACILWFVNFVRFAFHFENNLPNKPVICGFIGTALGVGMCYLMQTIEQITWF